MRNSGIAKNHLVIIALTVISAVAIGFMSAFMITASPEGATVEPILSAHDSDVRIVSPTASRTDTSLPAVTDDSETSADKALEDTPENTDTESAADTTASPETNDDDNYTTVSTQTITVSAPAVETEAVTTEPPAPETEAPEVTEAPETEPEYVIPEIPDGFLADELGVPYSICTPKYAVTEEELRFVATIVQLEVMGNGSSLYRFEDIPEKYFEMLSVAQCIRNRMESKRFPNSASEVMFQSLTTPSGYIIYQFSPREKLEMFEPTYEAMVAAREVLLHGVSVLPDDYFYFCATRICSSFEADNGAVLGRTASGSFDKIDGHLTTFYAGY